MSARSLMTQRAQVSRDANAGARDRNNQPAAPDWQPVAGQVPCFLWSDREYQVDGALNAKVEQLHLGVPVDAAITTADQISAVYNAQGTAVLAHTCRITGDQRMGWSHRELTLEVVASAVGASA